eukprot:4776637-Ditylum_brightwellii.AAC.1
MSIVHDQHCFNLLLTIPSTVELLVQIGVGDCLWPISSKTVLSCSPMCALENSTPTSDSEAELRKKCPPALLCPSGAV